MYRRISRGRHDSEPKPAVVGESLMIEQLKCFSGDGTGETSAAAKLNCDCGCAARTYTTAQPLQETDPNPA